ncbi:MAG: tail fiber protein [Desulfobacterales bacterium]|nr:tail fiber protein [Desulfobacterales bacterium]
MAKTIIVIGDTFGEGWGKQNAMNTELYDATSANSLLTGEILTCPFETVPAGFLECDGSTINRTTYADLFTAIGDLYGIGDGSTTFEIPDYRGVFLRCWDHGAGIDVGADQDTTGDTHTNTTIDNIADTSGMEIGMTVTGSGIPASTTISSVDSGVAITISQAATSSIPNNALVITSRTDAGDGSTVGDSVGTVQTYGNSAHTHTGTTAADGAHNHQFYQNGGSAGGLTYPTTWANGQTPVLQNGVTTTSTTHTHTFTSNSTGGIESRPKNINVMYIIRY